VDGTNPGINADEIEALLDLEWSHALASGAAQVFYLDDHTNAATGISIVDSLQRAVADRSCSVISVSFTLCGNLASFMTQTFHPIASQAAAQGQSIFVSSG
jgi:subtilase family serine protease